MVNTKELSFLVSKDCLLLISPNLTNNELIQRQRDDKYALFIGDCIKPDIQHSVINWDVKA